MRDYAIIFAYIFYEFKPKLAHEIRGKLVRMSKKLWVPLLAADLHQYCEYQSEKVRRTEPPLFPAL